MATPRMHSTSRGTRFPVGHSGHLARMLSATAIDAIELLEGDHRQVESWFAEFERAGTLARKQSLADRICGALRVHMRIEEEIFYPAFLDAVGDRTLYEEAETSHEDAREMIADVESCDAGDDANFDILLHALAHLVDRHVREEEQAGGMFDEARQSGVDLYELGARLEQRKIELMDQAFEDR